MKKKIKKVLLVIGIIIVVFAVIIGYFVYKDLKQEEVLKQEVITLSNKDLLNDNYDIEIKTTGEYAYVENAVKKFYKELSDNVKKLNTSLDDEALLNILAPESLEKDRPNFINSHLIISKAKNESTEALNKIANLCSEEYIKNLLDKEKVSDYYLDFYQKIMYTENDLKELKETKEEMEEVSNNINLFLSKVEELLDLLEKYNASWVIEDKQIYFETTEQVNEYNNLYQEIVKIAEEKLDVKKDKIQNKIENNV